MPQRTVDYSLTKRQTQAYRALEDDAVIEVLYGG